jgi:hypothetical protein
MTLTVVSYGGGVNSKAMCVEWLARGNAPPDLILFADTGGERPAVRVLRRVKCV